MLTPWIITSPVSFWTLDLFLVEASRARLVLSEISGRNVALIALINARFGVGGLVSTGVLVLLAGVMGLGAFDTVKFEAASPFGDELAWGLRTGLLGFPMVVEPMLMVCQRMSLKKTPNAIVVGHTPK